MLKVELLELVFADPGACGRTIWKSSFKDKDKKDNALPIHLLRQVYVGSFLGPSWLLLALLDAMLAHLGAFMSHLVAKMSQHSAKMGPSCRNIAIFVPKMAPKSIKNRWKIDAKTGSGNFSLSGPIFHRFFMDFGPPFTWKSSKNHERGVIFHAFATSTARSIPTCFWGRFCIVFSFILAPHFLPKRFQKPIKKR